MKKFRILQNFKNDGTDKNDEEFAKMTLVEHLGEFRKRLIIVVICFFLLTMVSLYFVQFFVDKLILLGTGYEFIYITPSEIFTQYLLISVIAGLVATSPVILYEIWKFLCPGLKTREKAVMFFAFMSGFVFFCIGAAFAFLIMLPVMLQYFLKVNTTQLIRPMISFANYISFITSTLLTFGIVFEMPVVTMVLTQLGLLKPEWLVKSRKTVIVAIFVIAAFLTPPDVISQTMVAIPMLVLYELSVIVCKLLVLRKRRMKQ